jgi:hypothetical protein
MINKVYLVLSRCLILTACCISLIFGGAYTIKNIAIQSKGISSFVAKESALKDGRKQAFRIMIEKLVDKKDLDRFETTADQTIEFLIDSFQVLNEQMGPQSYKATVSFDFNKQRMEEFLRNKSVPFIVPIHKVILILPVMSAGAKTYLFEKENPWFKLWKHHSFNQALMTFVIPNGDLIDMNSLDAEDALIGANHKLITIAQRYQVSAIVVPYISITNEGRILNVRLDFQEYDSKGIKKNNLIRSHNLSEAATDVSKKQMLDQLLSIAIQNIQDFCKSQFGGLQEHNLVYLKIPTQSSEDYYKYIKLLNESTMVQEIQPVELSKEFSVLRVRTLYTLEDLLRYFKERGYNFEASQDVVNPYAYEALPKR